MNFFKVIESKSSNNSFSLHFTNLTKILTSILKMDFEIKKITSALFFKDKIFKAVQLEVTLLTVLLLLLYNYKKKKKFIQTM